MNMVNSGEVTVYTGKEDTKKVADFLDRLNAGYMPCEIKENVITFDGVEGDFQYDFEALVAFCKGSGIKIDFDVRFYGDYDGGYSYNFGNDKMEVLNAFDVMVRDGAVSDSELIEECKRRGIWPEEEEE